MKIKDMCRILLSLLVIVASVTQFIDALSVSKSLLYFSYILLGVYAIIQR